MDTEKEIHIVLKKERIKLSIKGITNLEVLGILRYLEKHVFLEISNSLKGISPLESVEQNNEKTMD